MILGACSFDTSTSSGDSAGLGETESESESGNTVATESGSDGTSTTGASASGSSPSGDPSDPSDPSDPTTETDTFDPTTDTDPGGGDGASVELEGDDFGNVDYQSTPTRTYTLSNVGDAATENLAIVPAGPFALDSTDCPASLDPAGSCTATVSHNADTLGPFSGELQVGYDNADGLQEFSRALDVEVVGETGNLISDPGFEGCTLGMAPSGWQVFAGPAWTCEYWEGLPPHAGDLYLSAPASDLDNFNIGTFIDLTPYEHAISTGSMSFELRGQARAWDENNDLYRLRIRYRNAGGVVQTQHNPPFTSSGSWTLQSDVRTVPGDVSEARIDFYCQKSGGNFCDAYLDTLSLVGTYNP